MKPIAVFYHCLFFIDKDQLPSSIEIVDEQMRCMKTSGLEEAASEIHVGINGGEESRFFSESLLPSKAQVTYHGLKCRNELRTILMLEEWVKTHPGWNVLYFHSKGATHAPGSSYGHGVSEPWRIGMMQDLVLNWKQCVAALETHDVACSHFMRHMADGTQNISAGNFWWATSDFLATLPTMMLRDRLKVSGIDSVESRYEAEVWIGNGRMPKVKEFRPSGGGGVP